MQPQPSLNLIPTIQQAITSLLTVYEPEFLRFGTAMFMSFAAIVICWQGIRMMFARGGLGDGMFDFAKLLLFVSFGYAMIAYYEAPLPGIGVSFSNLITDQTGYFQSVLEARAFDNIYRHFDTLGRALHAAGPVGDSRQPDLLVGAAAHRVRQGRVAGGDLLRARSPAPCARCSARSSCRSSSCRSSTGCSGAGCVRSSSTRSCPSSPSRS